MEPRPATPQSRALYAGGDGAVSWQTCVRRPLQAVMSPRGLRPLCPGGASARGAVAERAEDAVTGRHTDPTVWDAGVPARQKTVAQDSTATETGADAGQVPQGHQSPVATPGSSASVRWCHAASGQARQSVARPRAKSLAGGAQWHPEATSSACTAV